ncbi:colanic acid/amylovoran biosynthesis glycosyltransferase [Candidatus Methanomarinus sp.]|nr:colanic acid/amylovoran biosynthesis glycosyltransferase [ANME-2 cluster archaeon]
MKPVVAHLTNQYLPLTQTWLYHNQIINLKRYKPIVIAQNTINIEKFPTQDVYSFSNSNFFLKLANTLYLKVTGHYFTGHAKNIIKKNNVKLLHAHFGTQGVIYLKLKKSLDLPMITTFYGFDVSRVPRIPYWNKRYIQLFKDGELFLTEGNNMKMDLIKLGCPKDKIIVQHLGVDIKRFSFTSRTPPPDGKIIILIAGSFTEKKGIPYAIKAFAKVKKHHPNIQLRILGDGQMRNQIELLIKKLEISESVKLLGYQPHDVFLKEANNAHIFMLPSITAQNGDTEGGAPVVIIEAQATGLPIISSYHADIPDVVVDNESALLAPEKDVECLAKHLEYLVEHPDLWDKMGRIGRKYVEQEYDLTAQVQKLENIFDTLIT